MKRYQHRETKVIVFVLGEATGDSDGSRYVIFRYDRKKDKRVMIGWRFNYLFEEKKQ